MFGIGMYEAYGKYVVGWLGGTNGAAIMAVGVRLIVGVCWYFMFKKAGQKGYMAFMPIVGPYTAFHMVWDDFSMSAIFASTTFIAFIHAVGVDYPIINACGVINYILWWIMALLTAMAFKANIIMGFLYGGVPWLGAFLFAFWPTLEYKGAWSTDPEADQNLTPQERKKRRRKAERAAKAAGKKK